MKYLLILLLALPVVAQTAPKNVNDIPAEPPKCEHKDADEFYDSLRHSGPVNITHSDGRTVTVVIYKKHLIEHKTFSMDGKTRKPKDFFVMDLKRKWFFLYCLSHSYLLVAEPIK